MASAIQEPVAPTRRDMADLFHLGIVHSLVGLQPIVQWADSIVEFENEPPAWAVDLSLVDQSKPGDAISLLKSVPGAASERLPQRMLLAVLRRRWLAKALSERAVKRFLFSRLHEGFFTADEEKDVYYLDDAFDLLDAGSSSITEDEARQTLDDFLSRFQAFEQFLPPGV